MQNGYHVQPATLRHAATALRHTAEYVGTTRHAIAGGAVAASAFGTVSTSAAAASAWVDALATFDHRLSGIGTRLNRDATSLTTVATHYEEADRKAAAAYAWLHDTIAVLHRGSRGAAVVALQQRLREAGFDPGPVDGSYGPLTAQAVAQYTARHPARSGGPID